jgi:hypothetical protein
MPERHTRMPNGVMRRTDGEEPLFSTRHRVCVPPFCYIYDDNGLTGRFYYDADGRVLHQVQYLDYLANALIRDSCILAMFESKAHIANRVIISFPPVGSEADRMVTLSIMSSALAFHGIRQRGEDGKTPTVRASAR